MLAALAGTPPAEPQPIGQAEVEARYSDLYVECARDAMATADTIFCISTEAVRQEPKLEQALAAALKSAQSKRRAALGKAQSAWRDKALADCAEAAAAIEFERGANIVRGQCMLDAMIRRTLELERAR